MRLDHAAVGASNYVLERLADLWILMREPERRVRHVDKVRLVGHYCRSRASPSIPLRSVNKCLRRCQPQFTDAIIGILHAAAWVNAVCNCRLLDPVRLRVAQDTQP